MATKVSYNTPTGGQVTLTRSELRNDEGDPFKVHLEKLVEKNKPYFNHLGGTFHFFLNFNSFSSQKVIASAVNAYVAVASVPRVT